MTLNKLTQYCIIAAQRYLGPLLDQTSQLVNPIKTISCYSFQTHDRPLFNFVSTIQQHGKYISICYFGRNKF